MPGKKQTFVVKEAHPMRARAITWLCPLCGGEATNQLLYSKDPGELEELPILRLNGKWLCPSCALCLQNGGVAFQSEDGRVIILDAIWAKAHKIPGGKIYRVPEAEYSRLFGRINEIDVRQAQG
jgi:hypothetical protein